MRITILSGSPREGSLSRRVALHLQTALRSHPGVESAFINLQTDHLPPIQKVWSKEDMVPEARLSLYQTMQASEGFIVVSPEYNGGYSPALKNLLDHFPKSVYERKPWGVVTSSNGAMGGMRASQQLLHLGSALFAISSPRMLVVPLVDKKFDETGKLMDDTFQTPVNLFLEEYLWLAQRLHG